jgi:DNA repair photolyase
VTDCYQPIERKLEITRRCLGVLVDFRHPATFITKNHLITRDVDHLAELAKWNAVVVMLSITTLDVELARKMEPRASAPKARLEAIQTLAEAGVPVGVMAAPMIPGLTDHEAPAILAAAARAGAKFAGTVPLRLPQDVAVVFSDWLTKHFPDRKDKVLNRVRSLRGGKLNDANFGSRFEGGGVFAEQMHVMFNMAKKKAGLDKPFPTLSIDHFRRPTPQLSLFD